LIKNGCDPLVAIAGSVIEEPRPPCDRSADAAKSLGALIGVLVALTYVIWRALERGGSGCGVANHGNR
jgi:hypothetical protein